MNDKVVYNLNGYNLTENEIFVSKSEGLTDLPKQKPRLTFDWAEYDGVFYDFEDYPRYKQRFISLNMFIIGQDWEEIIIKFQIVKSELSKQGTQRLVIEPFNFFPLVYDVILDGEIKLNKDFREGRMYGTFKLNLIEPVPIKRIIRADGLTVGVRYQSFQQTIVNVNGAEHVYEGDVDVSFEFSQLEGNYIAIYGEIANLMLTNGADITQ